MNFKANSRSFKAGDIGNPTGENRYRDKLFRKALLLAINEECEELGPDNVVRKVKRLRLIADQLTKQAMAGDISAIKEIADRIDGKPVQSFANDEDNPLFTPTLTDKQLDVRISELIEQGGAAGASDGTESPEKLH